MEDYFVLPGNLEWQTTTDDQAFGEQSRPLDLIDQEGVIEKLCDELTSDYFHNGKIKPHGQPWTILRKLFGSVKAHIFRNYIYNSTNVVCLIESCFVGDYVNNSISKKFDLEGFRVTFYLVDGVPHCLKTYEQNYMKLLSIMKEPAKFYHIRFVSTETDGKKVKVYNQSEMEMILLMCSSAKEYEKN